MIVDFTINFAEIINVKEDLMKMMERSAFLGAGSNK
jgi:hypothetical protein